MLRGVKEIVYGTRMVLLFNEGTGTCSVMMLPCIIGFGLKARCLVGFCVVLQSWKVVYIG